MGSIDQVCRIFDMIGRGIFLCDAGQTLGITAVESTDNNSQIGTLLQHVDDGILPLHRLDTLLQVPDAAPDPHYAMLVRRDEEPLGLCVDAVEGHEEVVVKPLPEPLRGIPGLEGVTILGEGQTVLILDRDLQRRGALQ